MNPENFAGVRYLLPCHYQTSLPCGGPKSTASRRFFAVIPFSRSSRTYVFCRTGSMTFLSFSSSTSTTLPDKALAVRYPGQARMVFSLEAGPLKIATFNIKILNPVRISITNWPGSNV